MTLPPVVTFAIQAMVGALITWLLGQLIAVYWQLRQKRRELALNMADRFWRCYGEFFVTWKVWNYSFEESKEDQPEKKRRLLERITTSESEMEAILLKLICERELCPGEIEATAKFRQAYQQLRECVRLGQKLDWKDPHDERYVALKGNAAVVSHLISTIDRIDTPVAAVARRNVLEATAQKWEKNWTEPVSKQ